MAITTCKGFTYAKVSGGGAGSAVTYTGGTALVDYLAKVDINEERTNEDEYADGHKIDSEKIPTGVSMALELVAMSDSIRQDILGLEPASNTSGADLLLTETDPPFVGAGCLMADRFKGATSWIGIWIYKIQFAHQGISAETRRERTVFQHESINGDAVGVQLASDGKVCYYAMKSGMTESTARTWLNTHAGVSSSSGGGSP